MSLLLKVISSKNKPLQQEMEYEFSESGGTIGRKISNTWVLPDENRHLSGSHAKIEYNNGNYYIVDTSTNGVFINGNSKPLGHGNRFELEDGFQLIMGTFKIQVEMSNGTDVDSETSSDQSDDLFSDLLDDSVNMEINNGADLVNSFDNDLENKSNSIPIDIGSDDPFFEFGEFTTEEDSRDTSNEKAIHDNRSEIDSFFAPQRIKQSTKAIESENSFKDKNRVEPLQGEIKEDIEIGKIPDDWNVNDNNSIDDLLVGIIDPFGSDDKEPEKEQVIIPKKRVAKNLYQMTNQIILQK